MTFYVRSPNFDVLCVIINFLLAKNHRENILKRTISRTHTMVPWDFFSLILEIFRTPRKVKVGRCENCHELNGCLCGDALFHAIHVLMASLTTKHMAWSFSHMFRMFALFSGVFLCVFSNYSQSYRPATAKMLEFGSDPDHHVDPPIRNLAITWQIMSELWWNFQDGSSMMQEIFIKIIICWIMSAFPIGQSAVRLLLNLITCFFYQSGPLHKISSQSILNILSNVANRQTNKQRNTKENTTSLPRR